MAEVIALLYQGICYRGVCYKSVPLYFAIIVLVYHDVCNNVDSNLYYTVYV